MHGGAIAILVTGSENAADLSGKSLMVGFLAEVVPKHLAPLMIAMTFSLAARPSVAADGAETPLHPWRLQGSLFGTPLFFEESLGTDGHYGGAESPLFVGVEPSGRYEATQFVSLELGVGYELLWGAPFGAGEKKWREGDVRIAVRVPLRVLRFSDHAFEIVPEAAFLWGWTRYEYDAHGNTLTLAGPSARLAVRYLYALSPSLAVRFEAGARIDMLGFSPNVTYFHDTSALVRAGILATVGIDFAP
jgi:hypothetical protein